jgi:hypothetical protein
VLQCQGQKASQKNQRRGKYWVMKEARSHPSFPTAVEGQGRWYALLLSKDQSLDYYSRLDINY